MTRTIQIGLGVLAVVAATALSRRRSSGSLEGLALKRCKKRWSTLFEDLDSSSPEVTFSQEVARKNDSIGLSNKMVALDQTYSRIFGQYSDDLVYELSEEGYQSDFHKLTPLARSNEYAPNVDFYKQALIERFSSWPDMERLWVQLVDRIKIAKAANDLRYSLLVFEKKAPRDVTIDLRHPPSGWFMVYKDGKLISAGDGIYSFVRDGKVVAHGKLPDVTRTVTGASVNGYVLFNLTGIFVPSSPPSGWKIERTPDLDLALENAIDLFCEIAPFAYNQKWWTDIDWPADVRPWNLKGRIRRRS